jgi:hypothetical protein
VIDSPTHQHLPDVPERVAERDPIEARRSLVVESECVRGVSGDDCVAQKAAELVSRLSVRLGAAH